MPSRPSTEPEILWGIHPVLEALVAGKRRFKEIYITADKTARRLPEITSRAVTMKVPIRTVGPDEMKRICGSGRHQGLAAKVGPLPLLDFSTLLDRFSVPSAVPLILILDSIEDPHNLGALVRTGLCAGVSGIILPKDRSASPTPAVSRASAGALEHAPVCQVANLVHAMEELKKIGIWIIGLDRDGDTSIYDVDLNGARAVVIGGEDTGIRRLVARTCDFLCQIPQAGAFNSLNASVAGAVAIYEAFRQRRVK